MCVSRQYTQSQVVKGQHNVAECTQNIKNNINIYFNEELPIASCPLRCLANLFPFALICSCRTTAFVLTALGQQAPKQKKSLGVYGIVEQVANAFEVLQLCRCVCCRPAYKSVGLEG
jgi:hypothetical protein